MLYNYNWKKKYRDGLDFDLIQKLNSLNSPLNRQQIQMQEKHLDSKKREIYERKDKKDKIVKELTEIFTLINQDIEIESQDSIMKQLKSVKKEAANEDYQDIFMTVKTAIGRRIYNIQRQKNKVKKKQVMTIRDNYYKNDRRFLIELYPYDKLSEQKFLDNTFLFQSYPNGKGFNYTSCKYTTTYQNTFRQIEAQNVVKTVNRLFCKPEYIYETPTDKVFEYLRVIGGIMNYCVILFIIFQFTVFYLLEKNVINKEVQAEMMLTNILYPMTILIAIWLSIALKECLKTKETKTNFQKSIQLIEEYLMHINQKNIEDCKQDSNKIKFRWESSKKLYYITVRVNKILEANNLINTSSLFRRK